MTTVRSLLAVSEINHCFGPGCGRAGGRWQVPARGLPLPASRAPWASQLEAELEIIRIMNELGNARATLLQVGEEGEAQRIDNYLLRRLKGVPKSHVYRVLRSGEVRVNSGRIKPDYRLQPGDRVRVPPVRVATPAAKPAPRPLDLPIVYEDAALLVVDKPSGVAVHGGSGVSYGVIEWLRAGR